MPRRIQKQLRNLVNESATAAGTIAKTEPSAAQLEAARIAKMKDETVVVADPPAEAIKS